MKYAGMAVSSSDRGLDPVEELPPGVERVLERIAYARLDRGVGRMADDDVVAHVAVLRVGHLVDVPELHRLAGEAVVRLEPARHRPEGARDLALRRQVDRGRRLDEGALLGRQLEPVDQRAGRGKRAAVDHLRSREAERLAEADEELRVGLVAAREPPRLLLVDALGELDPLLRERTVGVHRAHGAGELAHLEEELDGEEPELLAAQLAVGDREPERVAAEGPAGLDARDEIPDEGLGGQNLAHRSLLTTPVRAGELRRLRGNADDRPSIVRENGFLKERHAGFSPGARSRRLPRGSLRVARRAPRGARAALRPARDPRRPRRPDAAREGGPVRRGLDAVGMARARRRTRRLADAADRARRGARGARPRGSGALLADRGARAHADRLRVARARRRRRPAPARGRRALVPGLLGAGLGERPRVAALPRRARRRPPHGLELGDPRPEGLDEPSPVLRPLCAAHADGAGRIAAPGHHRVLRRHGDAGDQRPAARDDQRRARVRRGVLRRRRGPGRPDARRAGRRLGRRDEHPPLRALLVLLAAHRVPLPAAAATRRRRAAGRPSCRGGGQHLPRAPRAPGPLARDAAPARGDRHARRGDVDRQADGGDRGADDLRRRPPAPGRDRRARRQRGRGAGAQRVPLLPRRDGLRRHRGGAAQHHRPPAPRARGRLVIGAEERASMRETVRRAIADALETGADVDAVLARLGWLEMLGDEPGDAIEVVFGALGAANATATALDDVLLSALGMEPRADLAALLPRFAAWDPPGRIDADELSAQGLATARAVASAGETMVVCGPASAPRLVAIPSAVSELRAVHGIDPTAGLRSVRIGCSAADARRLDPAAWRSAVALGRRALAHQVAGASRAMLDLACAHARERVQFGRPIASFQAVRHRLADALVAVEALEAALGAAREEPSPETAALAKAVAGRTARSVATHCQQVLAGIGFTAQHPFHRFLKRTLALEGIFGSADEIVLDVGRQLLAARRVPTLIEL